MIRKLLYTLGSIIFCWFFSPYLYAQSTQKLTVEQLPQTATAALNKKYSKYRLNAIVKKQDEQKGDIYEIELQRKNKLVYLVYDINGALLSTRKLKIFSFDGTEPLKKTPKVNDGHGHAH